MTVTFGAGRWNASVVRWVEQPALWSVVSRVEEDHLVEGDYLVEEEGPVLAVQKALLSVLVAKQMLVDYRSLRSAELFVDQKLYRYLLLLVYYFFEVIFAVLFSAPARFF